MPIILPANTITGGYEIANSLRFNQSDNPDLNKTIGTPTSSRKFSVSCWIKLSKLGVQRNLWGLGATSGATGLAVRLQSDDTLDIFDWNGSSNNFGYSTNQVFRDVSAWSHFLFAVDTEQSTAHDRVRIYHNGLEIEKTNLTDNPGDPSQNADLTISSGHTFKVGDDNAGANEWDGYIAEFVYIDGQQLDPTSFGEFDTDSGIWKPIDVSELTFGNNGFYLDFENSGSLGADVSGNGNNFTVNNLTSIDQSTDTPTNNFATLNPLIYTSSTITYSEGNLKASYPGAWVSSNGTIGAISGKYFWEAKVSSGNNQNLFYGISINNIDPDSSPFNQTGVICQHINGDKYVDGSYTASAAEALVNGDTLGVALDLDSGTKTVKFYKNGSLLSSSSSINLTSNFDNEFVFPFFAGNSSSASAIWETNFGSPPYTISSGNSDANGYGNFEYAVPSGYYALNTKNLAEFG